MQAFAEIITALAALAAVAVSVWNTIKIRDVHILINSRMSELLVASAHAARADGVVQGRKEVQGEQAELIAPGNG